MRPCIATAPPRGAPGPLPTPSVAPQARPPVSARRGPFAAHRMVLRARRHAGVAFGCAQTAITGHKPRNGAHGIKRVSRPPNRRHGRTGRAWRAGGHGTGLKAPRIGAAGHDETGAAREKRLSLKPRKQVAGSRLISGISSGTPRPVGEARARTMTNARTNTTMIAQCGGRHAARGWRGESRQGGPMDGEWSLIEMMADPSTQNSSIAWCASSISAGSFISPPMDWPPT